ncbi:MAG: redoxin domain-containing protein [Prevotella sp.]|nr:redoxin domain-containing protein [Prevotella sp.]
MKMKKTMKKTLAAVVAAILLAACGKASFKVEGNITDANDSILYLENMALDGPQVVDSVKLDATGDFSFSASAPEDAPEFYRLRIGQQVVNFCIDSIAVVKVKASYPSMSSDYEIEGGDDNLKIKQLSLMQKQLQDVANQIVRTPNLSVKAVEDSVLGIVKAYKKEVMANYIYKEPMKPYSYFALFQGIAVGNSYLMVFDPRRDVEDVKPYAAVATQWDTYHPNSMRGKNLHNITIEAEKTRRIVQAQNEGLMVDADKVSQTDIIDIILNDNKGVKRSLTDLKGKVVLLDFHVFAAEGSQQRILALRELYNKYHDRGLEIYQVSLDEDDHFWKTRTAALPWISVRDDRGASNVYLYQKQTLPINYIISRDNQVVMGPQQIKDLDADIAKYL